MAIKIIWAPQAQATFSNNVEYLLKNWSEKEVAKFVNQTEIFVQRVRLFPESYPTGNKSKLYRKARLNKYIVVFYRYYKTRKEIVLLSFWNTKQSPDKIRL